MNNDNVFYFGPYAKQEVGKSLYDFVLRVSKGKGQPHEVAILPEIARLVLSFKNDPYMAALKENT